MQCSGWVVIVGWEVELDVHGLLGGLEVNVALAVNGYMYVQ